ncbi:TIGR03560 family F420-dependent LLM class oxidoreductase [Streptomyces xiamenensis]
MITRLAYHIPYFHHARSPAALFPELVDQVRAAEAAGFDMVTTMDHFLQPAGLGPPGGPILEAYSLLGALAAVTDRVRLGTMVTGVTYRNPALLAKMITTVDVISAGRAVLGIGAAWHEPEHRRFGFTFGTAAERSRRLEEALQVVVPMLREGRSTFSGSWYRAQDALNEPRLRDDLPVLIGGAGERRTFALAVRHADHLNIICEPAQIPGKLAALRARCAEGGRDPATLETSFATPLIMDEDGDLAQRRLTEVMRNLGVDRAAVTGGEWARATSRYFTGTPAEVAERLREEVIGQGIGGLAVNMLADGHHRAAIGLAGRTLRPLVAGEG